MAIGRSYEVLVWATLKEVTRASMAAIEEQFESLDEVTEAFRMMGQPDYLIRVAVADAAASSRSISMFWPHSHRCRPCTSMTTMKTIKRNRPLRPS